MTAWLRREILNDLRAAKIISDGGFEPQRWDTDPPGQVNPSEHPASEAVTVAIGQEPKSSCGWVPVWAWDQVTGEEPDDYTSGVAALAEVGRREFDHIIRHDPRNVVADCEAKIAILDRYERQAAKYGENCMEEDRMWVLEPVVELLATGYRHREGFREEWLP